jgi:hypothetical protein
VTQASAFIAATEAQAAPAQTLAAE